MVSIPIDNILTLRTYQITDAPELFALVQAQRQHLAPWLNWVNSTNREEDSAEFIRGSLHKAEMQEGLALGIFYDGKLVGSIGMHNWILDLKKAELGYWLSKEYEGQGIICKSASGLITFLFRQVGLNKLEIHYSSANKRSGKVAEKLHFKVEGIIRQSLMRNGLIEDLMITGLLRNEWIP